MSSSPSLRKSTRSTRSKLAEAQLDTDPTTDEESSRVVVEGPAKPADHKEITSKNETEDEIEIENENENENENGPIIPSSVYVKNKKKEDLPLAQTTSVPDPSSNPDLMETNSPNPNSSSPEPANNLFYSLFGVQITDFQFSEKLLLSMINLKKDQERIKLENIKNENLKISLKLLDKCQEMGVNMNDVYSIDSPQGTHSTPVFVKSETSKLDASDEESDASEDEKVDSSLSPLKNKHKNIKSIETSKDLLKKATSLKSESSISSNQSAAEMTMNPMTNTTTNTSTSNKSRRTPVPTSTHQRSNTIDIPNSNVPSTSVWKLRNNPQQQTQFHFYNWSGPKDSNSTTLTLRSPSPSKRKASHPDEELQVQPQPQPSTSETSHHHQQQQQSFVEASTMSKVPSTDAKQFTPSQKVPSTDAKQFTPSHKKSRSDASFSSAYAVSSPYYTNQQESMAYPPHPQQPQHYHRPSYSSEMGYPQQPYLGPAAPIGPPVSGPYASHAGPPHQYPPPQQIPPQQSSIAMPAPNFQRHRSSQSQQIYSSPTRSPQLRQPQLSPYQQHQQPLPPPPQQRQFPPISPFVTPNLPPPSPSSANTSIYTFPPNVTSPQQQPYRSPELPTPLAHPAAPPPPLTASSQMDPAMSGSPWSSSSSLKSKTLLPPIMTVPSSPSSSVSDLRSTEQKARSPSKVHSRSHSRTRSKSDVSFILSSTVEPVAKSLTKKLRGKK